MSGVVVEVEAKEEGKPLWFLVLAIASTIAAAATALFGVPVWYVLVLPLFAAVMWTGSRRVSASGSREGLRVEGRLVVPRARMRDAWWTAGQKEEAPRAIVARDDGQLVVLEVDSDERAKQLVEALDPRGACVAGYVWTRREWLLHGTLVASIVLSAIFFHLPGFWAMLGAPMGTLLSLRVRRQIVAGDDGVTIRSMRSRRFVPWSAVESVHEKGIVLRDGTSIAMSSAEIATSRTRVASSWSTQSYDRLVAELKARLQAARTRVPHASAEASVAAKGAENGGYRGSALPDEALLGVVESADAAPENRVRAASELRARGLDDEVRVRIADAAQTVANPELRDDLAALAEDEARARK